MIAFIKSRSMLVRDLLLSVMIASPYWIYFGLFSEAPIWVPGFLALPVGLVSYTTTLVIQYWRE